jgi:hypothetical protein
LSLYVARFLEPEDKQAREERFKQVKALYNKRSAAVHGAKIKGDFANGVETSAKLLSRLIYKCIDIRNIPRGGPRN